MNKGTSVLPSYSAPFQSRLVWLDVAKGIGITLVVLGHVNRGLVNAQILPDSTLVSGTDDVIYAFHMPLFFFLSGLVVSRSLKRGKRQFVLGKIQSILFPYVLWSLLQGSFQLLLSSNTNAVVTTSDLWGIWWKPIGQFWFLYSLLACHLVVAFVSNHRALLLGICLVSAAMYKYPGIEALSPLALILCGLAYYIPGVLLTEKVGQSFRNNWTDTIIFTGLFGAAFVFGGYLQNHHVWGVGAILAAVLGICMTLSLSKVLEGWIQKLFAGLGVMSMTIFVLHVFAGAGARIVLKKLGIQDPSLHIIVGMAAGIIAPVMVHLALQKYKMLHYFGLGPIPRINVKSSKA